MKSFVMKLILGITILIIVFIILKNDSVSKTSEILPTPTTGTVGNAIPSPYPTVVASLSPTPSIELMETGSMFLSKNSKWWLNSGGKAVISGNVIKTIQGDLSTDNSWAIEYRRTNPAETDSGIHPQNIFRLVTRIKYQDVSQQMYFKINHYNLSSDVHRGASNGVLFFHHYKDGNNLYYAGLRVDGAAVIKKKINGNYYTLAYSPIYTESKYERLVNPNLIPVDNWIGIKTEITNTNPSTVSLKLYGDIGGDDNWTLLAEAVDDGSKYGGKAITQAGYAGIRSDFMDVEFKNYLTIVDN